MFLESIIFLISLVVVSVSAYYLGESVEAISTIKGLKQFGAAVLLSFAANLPDILLSLTSFFIGRSEMAVAGVVGAAAVNLLLVIGIAPIIRPIREWFRGNRKRLSEYDLKLDPEKLQADLPLLIGAVIIFGLLSTGAHELNIVEVCGLLFTYALLMLFMLYTHSELFRSHVSRKINKQSMRKWWLMLFGSLVSTIIFAVTLIFTTETLFINELNLPEKFVGFTIIAMVSALPEHVTAINKALQGDGNFAVGNAIGSTSQSLYFILGLLGLVAILAGNPLSIVASGHDIVLFAGAVILILTSINDRRLTWFEGWICLLMYIFAVASLII